MTRKMIVNAIDPEEVRIAILRGRTLEDFDIEARGVEKNKGNIYKGIVMAVEPALGAAFINYGTDKQGFLTAHDVHPKVARAEGQSGDGPRRIDKLLKPKQHVLVQVTKDEVNQKGAVLTTYLSLAGRYLVLMPDNDTQGVSRKINDDETRRLAREAAGKLEVPPEMGVIIRTAGRDRTKIELTRDLRVLLRLWDNIQKSAAEAKAPALIFKEQDVIIRALRDYFSPDIDEIVLDSDDAYDRAAEYMDLVMPNHQSALSRYVEPRPIFHHYRIEEQLALIYAPKVQLPSGGSIVIESTEALVAIDVNSGKQKSGNQEETATQTNVEAAVEVARQLRLRDLGGIVVVDFIDMNSRKNQQRVERTLKDGLRDDKARVKVGKISRNGTLEVTRQRIRSALGASIFDLCQVCGGLGHVLGSAPHAIGILRKLRDRAARGDLASARVRVSSEVANRLRTEYWTALKDLEKLREVTLDIVAEPSFIAGQDDFTFETKPDAVAVVPAEPNFGPAFGLPERPPAPAEDEIADPDADGLIAGAETEDSPMPATRRRGRKRRTRSGSPEAAAEGHREKHREGSSAEGHGHGMGSGRGPGQWGESLAMPTYELVEASALRLVSRAGRGDAATRAEPRAAKRRRPTAGAGVEAHHVSSPAALVEPVPGGDEGAAETPSSRRINALMSRIKSFFKPE